jgi:hypothetical protein
MTTDPSPALEALADELRRAGAPTPDPAELAALNWVLGCRGISHGTADSHAGHLLRYLDQLIAGWRGMRDERDRARRSATRAWESQAKLRDTMTRLGRIIAATLATNDPAVAELEQFAARINTDGTPPPPPTPLNPIPHARRHLRRGA